jgi:plasmid stabilization system protein ParE
MSEYSIRITRKADKDEQLIYEYIVENFGEIYAQKFRGKLFDALEKLKKYPMIGRVAKKDKSLRVLIPNDKNKIVYKVTENEIIVIRILNMKSKDSSNY